MESANDTQYLILINKVKAQLMQININDQGIHIYHIENEESRTIRDIEFYKHYACALYDKNEVIVYDLHIKERVFRSIFRDATSQITRLFYISDFDDSEELDEAKEEEYNRFKDDEVIGDDIDEH